MYNNNIPQYNHNMQKNYSNRHQNNNGDRFIGGGFFGPFILGGITGGLIANNRYNYPIYYQPYPYYYQPYPYYGGYRPY